MEETPTHFSRQESGAGLMDLLLILAENIKLLVLGSLAIGLLALGMGFVLPQTYQSVAILQADQTTASLMVTAVVLDPVIASLGLAGDTTMDQARTELRSQIRTAVGRNDKLLTLTVSARTAQQSQAIANAVLQRTFQESRPKGTVRERLQAQLAEARTRFKNAQDAAQSLSKQLESSGPGAAAGSEAARGYAELLTATGAAQNQISALESQLEGLGEAQVVQPPTLPERASHPRKGLIAMGATLAAGLGLMLFVFIRQAWRNTAVDEKNSVKLLRLRKSLGLN